MPGSCCPHWELAGATKLLYSKMLLAFSDTWLVLPTLIQPVPLGASIQIIHRVLPHVPRLELVEPGESIAHPAPNMPLSGCERSGSSCGGGVWPSADPNSAPSSHSKVSHQRLTQAFIVHQNIANLQELPISLQSYHQPLGEVSPPIAPACGGSLSTPGFLRGPTIALLTGKLFFLSSKGTQIRNQTVLLPHNSPSLVWCLHRAGSSSIREWSKSTRLVPVSQSPPSRSGDTGLQNRLQARPCRKVFKEICPWDGCRTPPQHHVPGHGVFHRGCSQDKLAQWAMLKSECGPSPLPRPGHGCVRGPAG